ncbi:unnamed protein product [Mytilus coruscus]|uniref:Uncharacterized protein n=1 Tax=Mytilus coruscus TaxID=42192 RepID=A0A6J8AFK3_MYTCO|nr:unnamed protein product [Mytilus coruscus]
MFTLIKDTDSGGWKIRANQGYSLMVDTPTIPLVEKCEVPQGNLVAPALLTGDQEGPVANIMREPIGAILPIENSSSIHKVAAPTETTLACDEEAQESWDSTSDGEADTTLEEGSSDEKIVIVCPQYQDSTCPTPVVLSFSIGVGWDLPCVLALIVLPLAIPTTRCLILPPTSVSWLGTG